MRVPGRRAAGELPLPGRGAAPAGREERRQAVLLLADQGTIHKGRPQNVGILDPLPSLRADLQY